MHCQQASVYTWSYIYNYNLRAARRRAKNRTLSKCKTVSDWVGRCIWASPVVPIGPPQKN